MHRIYYIPYIRGFALVNDLRSGVMSITQNISTLILLLFATHSFVSYRLASVIHTNPSNISTYIFCMTVSILFVSLFVVS